MTKQVEPNKPKRRFSDEDLERQLKKFTWGANQLKIVKPSTKKGTR